MPKIGIIGGGPAGLVAAIDCAVLGNEVTLFEKHRIGEKIRCAEGFFDSMRLLGKPSQGVLCKINALNISIKEEYTIDCSQLNLWMIDRKTWQRDLMQQAIDQGVQVLETHPIYPSELNKLKKDFDWIIDCSGTPSVTSMYYGFRSAYQDYWAYAYQLTIKSDFLHLFGSLKAGVKPNFLGYFWVFPKSREIANIGLGIFPQNRKYPGNLQTHIKEALNDILEDLHLKDASIIQQTGGVIPTYPLDELKYDNILLAGDSAGFSSPLHGGGIDMAVISGKKAAETIKNGTADFYTQKIKSLLLPKIQLEQKLIKIWEILGYDNLDRLMKLILKRESFSDIPAILKYQPLLVKEKETIEQFFKGFFYGKWRNS